MKILEEIKQEHDEIRSYFLQMENDEDKAPEIFKELATFVLAHHESEEHIVFPALSNKKKVKETKNNLKAEHAGIRRTMQIILDTPEDDDMWKAHLHLLKDLLTHHVEEEEEELFEIVREELDEAAQAEVYKQFEAYFKEVEPEAKAKVDEAYIIEEEDMMPKGEPMMPEEPETDDLDEAELKLMDPAVEPDSEESAPAKKSGPKQKKK